MKKVLFFIPSLAGGGAEKVLTNLVNNIDLDKFDITVLSLFNYGIHKKNLRKEIEYKFIFKRVFRGNVKILRFFSPKFLYNKMIGEGYDVVISYLEGPTMRIVSGSTNKQTKIINWIHNEYHDLNKLLKIYKNIKELKDSFKKYDKTVFVAKTAKNALIPLIPDIAKKNCVIYNTIDKEKIIRKSLEKIEDVSYDKNFINLISVGRFVYQKAFDRLIRITKKIIDESQLSIRLYLLGKGNLETKYNKLIYQLNLTNNVFMLGYKENPYKYIRGADFFVCSSMHEGFSTVVTESLLVETPVITTNCSGMEELLGKNNEYGLITNNDEISLYEGIRNLLQDEDEIQRLTTATKERGKFFDKEKAVHNVEELILKLSKHNREEITID